MQNTLNDSLSDMPKLPQVEVLLATFNGERHLSDFLRSLACQSGVEIHLRASDDGSTDHTIEILNQFKDYFTSFRLADGPRKGPAANFFSLMQKSELGYVALADQDDIWEENHLINSINRLKLDGNPLALTFSRVLESSNPKGFEGKVWPGIEAGPAFHEIFFENLARGCTFVMTKHLVKLVCEKRTDGIVMHDWWILLVAKSCGSVLFGHEAEVRYRLHSNNVVGRGPRLPFRIKSIFMTLTSRNWAPKLQLEALWREFANQMSVDARHELDNFFEISNMTLKGRATKVMLSKRQYRKNFLSDFLVKMYLIVENTKP
jgi:glycosyltransferase involved in cell wall biosynthesis